MGRGFSFRNAMRKIEKEIKDRAEIDSVIRRSQVCRLGMPDDGKPYAVPLSFRS